MIGTGITANLFRSTCETPQGPSRTTTDKGRGVSETVAIICDKSLSVLLACLKETWAKIFAKGKKMCHEQSTQGWGHIIEKFRIS